MRSLSAMSKDPGLIAAEEILVGAHEGPAEARFSIQGFTSAVVGRFWQVRGPVGGGPRHQALGSVLVSLIHPRPGPFTSVRGPLVRADQGRLWTVVNGGAQYSKACEGASLPWVQIPPPPPLTCDDASPPCLLGGGGQRGGLSFGPQMVSVGQAGIPEAGWIGPELWPCTAAG